MRKHHVSSATLGLDEADEALERAVIEYARSQLPSPETRERILSSVLAELGLANQRRKISNQ